jgi:cell wall-associated NlpC family hydrolase
MSKFYFKLIATGSLIFFCMQNNVFAMQGTVKANAVNIRALPSVNSQVISKVNNGCKINICKESGDWFEINYENNNAYIYKKFVACDKNKNVIVTAKDGLNLRESNSINSNIICVLDYNSVLEVLDESDNNWSKIIFENKIGYVNKKYISDTQNKPESYQKIFTGQKIINYAKQFIGTPYRYGGTNLKNGVDCSGFVYSVMKNFGLNLNRSSVGQAKNGSAIEKSKLLPGDLVFFSNKGAKNIQHVGIYMGDNKFIHSASPNNKGVTISKLTDKYYTANYITARRIL